MERSRAMESEATNAELTTQRAAGETRARQGILADPVALAGDPPWKGPNHVHWAAWRPGEHQALHLAGSRQVAPRQRKAPDAGMGKPHAEN